MNSPLAHVDRQLLVPKLRYRHFLFAIPSSSTRLSSNRSSIICPTRSVSELIRLARRSLTSVVSSPTRVSQRRAIVDRRASSWLKLATKSLRTLSAGRFRLNLRQLPQQLSAAVHHQRSTSHFDRAFGGPENSTIRSTDSPCLASSRVSTSARSTSDSECRDLDISSNLVSSDFVTITVDYNHSCTQFVKAEVIV